MLPHSTPAGRVSFSSPATPWKWVDDRGFAWDLQMFSDDDDDLGDAPSIDVGSLSDDPAQLKALIKTLSSDNRSVRKNAGNHRTRRIAAEQALEKAKGDHAKALESLKAEGQSALDAALAKLKDEHTAALSSITTERDAIVKERDDLKGERETLNRSNGQLRSKFREQFVDQRVRNDLEKRGAHNVDDAMKLLDVSKIEFDEEKLSVKDETGFKTMLDTFQQERGYLFGAANNSRARGTSVGRGSSDAGGNSGGKTAGFDDESLSIEAATNQVLAELGIT